MDVWTVMRNLRFYPKSNVFDFRLGEDKWSSSQTGLQEYWILVQE